jgi:hypothetical protein
MSIQSLTLRFTTGTPPTQVTTTQEIPLSSINLSGSNVVPISQSLIDAVNAQPAGTIFTPSIATSYGNDESGNAITRVTSPASNAPSFVPRVISLASVINKTATDAPFNLSGLFTTISAGVLSYSSSNPSVASVDSSGQVTLLAGGTTTITINVTATADHTAGSASTTLNITSGNPTLTWSNITKSLSSRAFPLVGNLAPSSTTAVSYGSEWNQLGGDIDGEAPTDRSGFSVSLSADGNIVAIGAPFNGGRGHARVFIRDTNEPIGWRQLGSDIDGEAGSDRCGISVILSADGNIVAVGSSRNDGTTGNIDDERGCVRVFKYHQNTNMWVQLGSNIVGEASQDYNGYFISLSSDGFIVAIAAPYSDGVDDDNTDRGRVRIFKYIETTDTWVQLGGNIDGDVNETSGRGGLSLSADGNIVAIGSPLYALGGRVRVFKYNQNTNMWVQLGSNIVGEAEGDRSGYSVSLSADGNIVAIGAPYNDGTTGNIDDERGHVRLFKYNQNTDIWDRLGGDIVGEAEGDASGTSVSLSADGTIVAIGATYNNGTTGNTNDYRGHTRVYIRDTNVALGWRQLGGDIDGEAEGDMSGYSVSLSADGTIVAIGAQFNDGNGSSSGHTRLYKINSFNNITYTSDTPAIAGVYGNIVLLRSAGTSILTAQQTLSLTTEVATATLTVT